jgi:hypothetical protein
MRRSGCWARDAETIPISIGPQTLRCPDQESVMFESEIAARGFAFVHADAMRQALEQAGALSDWPAFAASWNDLPLDQYLPEDARLRRRRFGVYDVASNGVALREPHQPHFQHRTYNQLFGGVERWFDPIVDAAATGETMTTVLRCCAATFGSLATSVPRWHVEVHQFRIEARADRDGEPTPEGVHRDGVDFVLVLLINRDNIVSGVTTAYDLGGVPLGTFTLTEPLDAALVDDNRVAHGVTPVAPLDPARPGCRDVLVVTFRRGA